MWAWLVACGQDGGTALGVSLDDGQVMVGEVTTPALRLEGVFGEIDVPLADIGVVLPVEATTLGESHQRVTVWLRNGSELRGRWVDPALALSVSAGGESVAVELPVDHVQGLQLRGGEEWPAGPLYRIRTTHGDDVLVDPGKTRIAVRNALGTFAPFLSECRTVGPVGDPSGDWRIELQSGTILVGPLTQDHLVLALPSGPDELDVPLTELVSLDQRVWGPSGSGSGAVGYAAGVLSSAPMPSPAAEAPAGRQGLGADGGWFANDRLRDAKR